MGMNSAPGSAPQNQETSAEQTAEKAQNISSEAASNLERYFGSVDSAKQELAHTNINNIDPMTPVLRHQEVMGVYRFILTNLNAIDKAEEIRGHAAAGHTNFSKVPPTYQNLDFNWVLDDLAPRIKPEAFVLSQKLKDKVESN